MLYIIRDKTDPYFNIAAEEYLLKNFKEDIFMIWQNQPSIIVGKHQNTLAEINLWHVIRKNIPVIRRISGGGAVFHDLGNVNFTFIQNGKDGEQVNFRGFTKPIIQALNHMGVPASFEGKNDIRVHGLKISGNAEHVYKKRVLHHGTLLFSSTLTELRDALKSNPAQFQDRSIQSIRSQVANIKGYLPRSFNLPDFIDQIKQHTLNEFDHVSSYTLSEEEINNVKELSEQKYKSWEWNYAYSPRYVFEKNALINPGFIGVKVKVEKGYIKQVQISSDRMAKDRVHALEEQLIGVAHFPTAIEERLQKLHLPTYLQSVTMDEFLQCLF